MLTGRYGLENGDVGLLAAKLNEILGGAWAPRRAGMDPEALEFAYHGGYALVDGVPTAIADGTVTVPDDTRSYIQRTLAGVVTASEVYQPALVPMAVVDAASGEITHFEDIRDLDFRGRPAFPLDPPLLPSVYDEEGQRASLDPAYTVELTPGGGFTIDTDRFGAFLAMDSPGAASNTEWRIRRPIGTEGDSGSLLTLTARLVLSAYTGTLLATELAIGDTSPYATANYLAFGLVQVSGVYRFQVRDGGSVLDLALPWDFGHCWVHLQRETDDTTSFWISPDGVSWRRVYSDSRTWDANYLWIRMLGAGAGEPSQHLVGAVRVNDPRFRQPA